VHARHKDVSLFVGKKNVVYSWQLASVDGDFTGPSIASSSDLQPQQNYVLVYFLNSPQVCSFLAIHQFNARLFSHNIYNTQNKYNK